VPAGKGGGGGEHSGISARSNGVDSRNPSLDKHPRRVGAAFGGRGARMAPQQSGIHRNRNRRRDRLLRNLIFVMVIDMKKIPALALAVAMTAPVLAEGIEPIYPMQTGNLNVRYIYEQYQVMLEEIGLSVSQGAAGTVSHDADRWKSYITGLVSYTAYWQSKAMIDWPVTHGRTYELDGPIDVGCDFKSNQAVCDLSALVISARDEIVVSASAKDIPMHMLPADLTRQQAYWGAMVDFIDQFMLVVQPLDEPITSAQEALGLPLGGTPKAQ